MEYYTTDYGKHLCKKSKQNEKLSHKTISLVKTKKKRNMDDFRTEIFINFRGKSGMSKNAPELL